MYTISNLSKEKTKIKRNLNHLELKDKIIMQIFSRKQKFKKIKKFNQFKSNNQVLSFINNKLMRDITEILSSFAFSDSFLLNSGSKYKFEIN
jgi:hypothetical protein